MGHAESVHEVVESYNLDEVLVVKSLGFASTLFKRFLEGNSRYIL